MNDFEARIKYLMTDRLEKYVAMTYQLTESAAREIIRKMSFAEHRKMSEASADFGNQSNSSASSAANVNPTSGVPKNDKQKDQESPFNPDGTLNTARNTSGAEGQMDLDGAMHDITIGQRFGSDVEVTTADGNKMRVPAKNIQQRPTGKGVVGTAISAVKKGKQNFVQGFNKGKQLTSSAEHDELNRLRELAGIEETCSAGATGAGSIAAAPSVIGDTAHTPTDTLRARLRKKKEKKKD